MKVRWQTAKETNSEVRTEDMGNGQDRTRRSGSGSVAERVENRNSHTTVVKKRQKDGQEHIPRYYIAEHRQQDSSKNSGNKSTKVV